MAQVKVLFVCLGNICRSPTAEGVFTRLVDAQALGDRIQVDSAGTHAYHVGAAPDRRAQQAARKRHIDISHLRGRQVDRRDFEQFDYILAMDHDNYTHLLQMSPPEHEHKVSLLLPFAGSEELPDEVPDPYYGGTDGFERVLDMIEQAASGLLEAIKQRHF